MPATAWHVNFGAQRQPDIAGGNTGGDGLVGGSPANRSKDEVTGEYAAIGVTKLFSHRGAKFAQSHRTP